MLHTQSAPQPPMAQGNESALTKHRKTVLYVDHTARMGGGEIALLNLITALNPEAYYPIVVLASQGPLVEKLRAAGIETLVELLDTGVLETRKDSLGLQSLLHLRQIGRLAAYAVRLARLARQLNVDLIHTNSLKSDLYGGLAGRLAGIPVLWHVRDSINDQYLPALVAATFRALSRIIPHVVVANSESTLRTLRPLRRQTTATVYSGVANLFPASDIPEPFTLGRMQIVHDGYDTNQFAAIATRVTRTAEQEAKEFPVSQNQEEFLERMAKQPVIALVGRVAEWKGQHIFIEAAAEALKRFPQTRFWIIGAPLFGEQEYERSLHQRVRELGLEEQIQFLGFQDDVPSLLSQVTIVVHASTLGEPFGQVVIEGMAAAKPVIATKGGALPEIVLPGETGILVPMGDSASMAKAMQELLADPNRAVAMGLAGRKRVQGRFTIRHTVLKLERVYEYLLQTEKTLQANG